MPGRIRTRRRFARLATPSARGASGPLRVAFVVDPDATGVDVAFAVPRKVGPAVARNRIRRRLRALLDELDPAPPLGSYLIRCDFQTGQLTHDQLAHHLREALTRAGL
ncbi:MAG TPA: ribonuclease P protein component [Acidimicrobiales bacterium]|nr:ribonuclease P protein component [Acidimicrobiales bacterium]